jgi:predicted DNA-binding WGR domain protein
MAETAPPVRGASASRAVRRRRLAQACLDFSDIITDLNQSVPTDSQLSLDGIPEISNSSFMISQPYHLYVERSDASKNMARYYAMSIEPNLFGDVCLLRKWGRIGTKGQVMVHHFGREEEAVRLFLDLLRQKRKRGYRPRVVST